MLFQRLDPKLLVVNGDPTGFAVRDLANPAARTREVVAGALIGSS